MILNSTEVADGQTLRADFAIVGAGAAGITLAHRLAAAGHDVLLLEGGGAEYDEASQSLYDGIARGTPWREGEQYLLSSRLRYLGGTTNHWAGWCRPMDAIDFERRDWIPHSGWPFGRDELARHFPGAEELLELRPFAESVDSGYGAWSLFGASDLLVKKMFHLSPPVRFRIKFADELGRSPRIRLVLRANVVGIDADESGGQVQQLQIAAAPDRRFQVRARVYVLAAGGIENPRLLLASDGVQRAGIGNANDLVGRFFMDHPHRRLGTAVLWELPENPRRYRSRPNERGDRFPVIAPTEDFRREHALGGVTVQVVKKERASLDDPVLRSLAALDAMRLPDAARDSPPVTAILNLRSEHVPNPDSRVTLGDERDRFGVRKVVLDWRLQEQDLRTIVETGRLVASEIARTGVGRVRLDLDSEDPWAGTDGGAHHVGTTRMAPTPSQGVVDPDCRVFGVPNLYVAGSSVYPTCGFVNPTFTLVALTLRLADHLIEESHRV